MSTISHMKALLAISPPRFPREARRTGANTFWTASAPNLQCFAKRTQRRSSADCSYRADVAGSRRDVAMLGLPDARNVMPSRWRFAARSNLR